MRLIVLLMSLAMPAVAWLSNSGAFGPTNGEISNRYPTLLVAAGYAFAIWGLIFVLDVVFGVWQMSAQRRNDGALARIRLPAAMGFALTALWMPVFSAQVFWLALVIIWAALVCMLACAVVLSQDRAPEPGQRWMAWLPLSLHAGWLALAAFLNTAQVVVAYRILPVDTQLPWSMALWLLAGALLLALNHRMRGNVVFAAAVLWALVAVYVKQSAGTLDGSQTAAGTAAAIAAVLAMQTLWLRTRRQP